MVEPLSSAVNDLVKGGELSLFQDTGTVTTIRRKQTVVSLQIIDKRKRKAKKKAVVLDRTWDYPIDIETAVCWDILHTLRNFALSEPEMQESWNIIFGTKWPELLINIRKPTPPDNPQLSDYYNFGVRKMKDWSKWQAYYIYGDKKRKHIGYFATKELAQEAGLAEVERQKQSELPAPPVSNVGGDSK